MTTSEDRNKERFTDTLPQLQNSPQCTWTLSPPAAVH